MIAKKSAQPLKDYTGNSIDELVTKIHVITGWRLPKAGAIINILCEQLHKKLRFDFPGISHDEIENAFHKFGSEENFTGTMNIAVIDRVLKKYFLSKAHENFENERKSSFGSIPVPSPQQHLNECRELIEHKYQLYLEGKMRMELLPPFIFPILRKDYNADPDLPKHFISGAKQFIRNRSDTSKVHRNNMAQIGELVNDFTGGRLQDVATKLALQYCFETLKQKNYQQLYTCEL